MNALKARFLAPAVSLGALVAVSPAFADASDPGYAAAVTSNFPTTYVLSAFLAVLVALIGIKVAKKTITWIVSSI